MTAARASRLGETPLLWTSPMIAPNQQLQANSFDDAAQFAALCGEPFDTDCTMVTAGSIDERRVDALIHPRPRIVCK